MLTEKAPAIVGTCPACGKAVYADEPDGPVWTCPADLNDANPYRLELPEDWRTTEAQKEAEGYYAECPEGRPGAQACPFTYPGGPGHLPLHSECYHEGDY